MVYYVIKNHIYVCTYNVCIILKGSGKMKKLLIANLSVLVLLVLLTGYNFFSNSEMFGKKNGGGETQPIYGAIKRDKMLKGESIPFKVESKRIKGWQNGLPSPDVFFASSPRGLEIANILAFGDHTSDYASNEKYNEEFFKENTLIILTKTFGSGSYRMRVDSLVKYDRELSFNITVLSPDSGRVTDDLLSIAQYIEVKTSDITGLDIRSYYEANDTYPAETNPKY